MEAPTSEQKQVLMVESALQKKIIDLLESAGPMTRADMVVTLQIARSTIYDTLLKLLVRNVVGKYSIQNYTRGRPKIVFVLNPGISAS